MAAKYPQETTATGRQGNHEKGGPPSSFRRRSCPLPHPLTSSLDPPTTQGCPPTMAPVAGPLARCHWDVVDSMLRLATAAVAAPTASSTPARPCAAVSSGGDEEHEKEDDHGGNKEHQDHEEHDDRSTDCGLRSSSPTPAGNHSRVARHARSPQPAQEQPENAGAWTCAGTTVSRREIPQHHPAAPVAATPSRLSVVSPTSILPGSSSATRVQVRKRQELMPLLKKSIHALPVDAATTLHRRSAGIDKCRRRYVKKWLAKSLRRRTVAAPGLQPLHEKEEQSSSRHVSNSVSNVDAPNPHVFIDSSAPLRSMHPTTPRAKQSSTSCSEEKAAVKNQRADFVMAIMSKSKSGKSGFVQCVLCEKECWAPNGMVPSSQIPDLQNHDLG
jgi:hypothetical protein